MSPTPPHSHRLGLTLGPVLYNWPTERWVDFYARIADEAPVDRVAVGEVVCSKRTPFREHAMVTVIERLQRGGKEVAYATLALPTLARETAALQDAVESGLLGEANDVATIHLLDGRPHVIGPLLNIYNEAALLLHLCLGATRVCLPVELALDAIVALADEPGSVEVFVFGRPPLAVSARCYHARVHGLPKDACQFVCERDPDGLDVFTLDDAPFLSLNGIQTLGHGVIAATRHIADLGAAGVASLRLSPQSCDMVRVASIFRDLADARIDADEATAALGTLPLPGPLTDDYLQGGAAWRRLEID
jgi:collagenase-like PrtC family protease